ncbi:hypothetical protein [Streptomyces sp. NPDC056160]|uniref:hypothetical protein n=1 Tax=Streptomyces sp. NPDC056160 TaxID=3345731 RepID=UPI0035E22C62
MCTRCGEKFTDERWQETTRFSWPGERDRLCGPCAKEAAHRAEAERAAERQAEDLAAGTAAQAQVSKARGLFKRRG